MMHMTEVIIIKEFLVEEFLSCIVAFHMLSIWEKIKKIEKGFNFCFVHSIFRFWFLVTFGDEVTKIRKYYVIFVYILQGTMGKTEKRKENHATKVTKIPKTKRQKYGMSKI